MFRLTALIGALSFFLLWPQATDAKKCPFLPYVTEGTVIISDKGAEPDMVKVTVFLGSYEYPSAYPPTREQHDYAAPAADGRFEFTSYLSTTADDGSCTEVPESGEAIFLGPGLRTQRVLFELPGRKKILRKGGATVDLGDVQLTSVQRD